jgi:hypothetical protein
MVWWGFAGIALSLPAAKQQGAQSAAVTLFKKKKRAKA